jgi:hypothetical protein
MLRKVAYAVVAGAFFLAIGTPDLLAAKNQMVKGTVKSVSPTTDVLIVNQKLQNGQVVDRELTITKDVEWSITTPKGTETLAGRDGLKFLVGEEGATIQVKCDKDVNVISIKVMLKKK